MCAPNWAVAIAERSVEFGPEPRLKVASELSSYSVPCRQRDAAAKPSISHSCQDMDDADLMVAWRQKKFMDVVSHTSYDPC